MPQPRILFIDIETLPNQSFTWGKWQQDVMAFKQEGCIATVAYKWRGSPKVECLALPQYRGYKPWSYDDSLLVRDVWKVLDEADIVVAHHGLKFDFKKMNARFIFHKLKPPSPYKTVDTKKVAKDVAMFNSNKLDDLGETLGEGRKIKTDFTLWQGCMEGKPEAWAKMIRYNKQAVLLLERIYNRLLAWTTTHPNHGLWTGAACCPKCGSRRLQFRGYGLTTQRRYRRFQCLSCGGWGRETIAEKGTRLHTNG